MTDTTLTFLRVSSTPASRVVDAGGNPVRLRGVALGGWMNMENFINGYPGAEHTLRTAVDEALGEASGEFFFDRLLDHVLAEEDIAFMKELGANVVRLALNYRQFEDDDRPFVYKEEGFERLQRAIEWCGRHNIYAVLDLHAVQGWQNPDWHSDNPFKHALLWNHPHFQDRLVALWKQLARRYRGNPVIAGYDVINEPATLDLTNRSNWDAINCVYRRIVDAIRRIDPDHIIFLEGDAFGSRFAGLEAPFADNIVYSAHDYSLATFGPGPYPGETRGKYRDRAVVRQSFMDHQGTRYACEHGVPLWIGEFGAVYNGVPEEIPDRLRALDDQLDAFEEFGAHWTIWTYKDVGVMGVVTLDPQSEYMQLLASDIARKTELAGDSWIHWLPRRPVHDRIDSLAALLNESIPDLPIGVSEMRSYIGDIVVSGYASTLMQPGWASRFKGMSETEIDRVLQSFALRNCRPNEGLIAVLKRHFARPA